MDENIKIKDVTSNLISKVSTNLSVITGWFYKQYKIMQERLRVWTFNRNKEIGSSRILGEIIYHSKKLLVYFFLLAAVSAFLDFVAIFLVEELKSITFLTARFDLPSREFIGLSLEIFIGATAAILGLIFALYSVGFQISTEKYSEEVTEYINQERVGNYFFSLLVFTVLFSLFTLLKLELTNGLPLASFTISLFLVALSILGIIIFKDDYLIGLKPISLFQRMRGEVHTLYSNASQRKSQFSKSYSIVHYSQRQVARLISIGEYLFDDLKRNQDYEDASFGPLFFGEILRDYLDTKRYIDTDRVRWFPQRYERVKADDMTMYPIKASYEMHGIAPLTVTKPYFNWLEDRILRMFESIQNSTTKKKNLKIFSSLINAYKIVLAGRYLKDSKGYKKVQPGAFENQELYAFDKTLAQFFDLYNKLPKGDMVFGEYLNALHEVRAVIVDGFNLRERPGILISWQDRINPWIDRLFGHDKQLGVTKKEIRKSDLPLILRGVLIDFWEQLEVEVVVEGQIITPKDALRNEIERTVANKEKEVIKKNLSKLITHNEQLIRSEFKSNKQGAANCLLINFFTLVQLIDGQRWEEAEELIGQIKNDLVYILHFSRSQLKDIELREPIEKALFIALVNRKKGLFAFSLEALLRTLIVLLDNEQDQNVRMRLMRVPLMVGGLAYLVSELDQDFYYAIRLAQYLEGRFYKEGMAVEMIEIAEKIQEAYIGCPEHFQLILEEANRYRHFYRYILDEIGDLPEDWYRDRGEIGLNKTVKHTSEFIRKIAAWEFSDMEQCIRGFIEWMQRREQIRKLVFILNNITNEFLK